MQATKLFTQISNSFFISFALSACSITGSILPSNQLQVAVSSSGRSYMDQQAQRSSSAMHEFLLGQLKFKNEDPDGALDHFVRASDLAPEALLVLDSTLPSLYLRRADLVNALKEVEKILSSKSQDVELLVLKAGLLEGLERDQDAKQVYSNILKLDPKRLDAIFLTAKLNERLGLTQEALVLFESLTRFYPNDMLAHYFLALSYENRAAFVQAERAMREALRLDPNSANLSLELIRILIKQRNFVAAKISCNEILKLQPNNEVVAKILHQLSHDPKNLEQAVQQLQTQSKVAESVVDSHLRLAMLLTDRKEFRAAVREFELVIAIDPQQSQARYYLASILAGSGRKKEALDQLFAIEEDQEVYSKAQTFASFLLRQSGDLVAAEISARKALEAEPDDKNLLSYLTLILKDAKKLDQAEDLMTQAIKRDPNNDRLLYNYAVLLREMGQESDSQRAMERVLEVKPDHSDALNYVAYNLVEQGKDLERAQKLIERALSLRPNDGYYLDTLGWLQYQKGQYHEAKVTLQRAVSSTGNDIEILEHYADTLVKLEQYDLALDTYRSAIELGRDSQVDEDQQAVLRIQKKVEQLLEDHSELKLPKAK